MLSSMRHRGPDGTGVHMAPALNCAIGMRRLSIIDLAGGHQPIWNEDKSIAVICNGEIYNHIELRSELRARKHAFRTGSDVEVIVHLYEEMGIELNRRLRGMFAFCILDTRQRRLFLARDHFGQKPLYYACDKERFAFASEIKALLNVPWINRSVDDQAFWDYASWCSLPPPRTHFKHIIKLAAGSHLSIDLHKPVASIERYWRYDLSQSPDLLVEDHAADQLDAALKTSVGLHLRSDVPVGVLLSGGLDSRVVATYAGGQQQAPLHAFTVGFAGEGSELDDARDTARQLGMIHHAIDVDHSDCRDSIDEVVSLLDEPNGDPACFAMLKVCKFAREHVKVLLSGEGSDELFAGYDTHYRGLLSTIGRTDKYRGLSRILPRESRFADASRLKRFLSRVHGSQSSEALLLSIRGLPGDVRNPRGLSPQGIQSVYRRSFELSHDLMPQQRDMLCRLLSLDIEWRLAESLLQKADKMSMGASIELRTPILDVEVADIAARIPSSMKLADGGPGKYILRKVLARKIEEPLGRPKKGFPLPIATWLRGPLRDRVADELLGSKSIVAGYLGRPRLMELWGDLQSGGGNAYLVFALWHYERWRQTVASPQLKCFVEGPPQDIIAV